MKRLLRDCVVVVAVMAAISLGGGVGVQTTGGSPRQEDSSETEYRQVLDELMPLRFDPPALPGDTLWRVAFRISPAFGMEFGARLTNDSQRGQVKLGGIESGKPLRGLLDKLKRTVAACGGSRDSR